jgi:hypothetical protein
MLYPEDDKVYLGTKGNNNGEWYNNQLLAEDLVGLKRKNYTLCDQVQENITVGIAPSGMLEKFLIDIQMQLNNSRSHLQSIENSRFKLGGEPLNAPELSNLEDEIMPISLLDRLDGIVSQIKEINTRLNYLQSELSRLI